MFSLRSLVSCSNSCLKKFRFWNIQSKNLLANMSFVDTTVPFTQHRTLFKRTGPEAKENSGKSNVTFLNQIGKFLSRSQKEEEIIYTGNLASRVRAIKIFSLTTSITGLAAQPMVIDLASKLGGTGVTLAICGCYGFLTIVTPLLLHLVTKKYVTKLQYNRNTDEYTATTVSLLLTNIKTKFKPSDVVVPDDPGLFTSFQVGKRSLFVEPTLFYELDHYVKIMGYDKSMDCKLSLSEPTTNPENDEPKKCM